MNMSREGLSARLPLTAGPLVMRRCERDDWDLLSGWPPYPFPLQGFKFSFTGLDAKAKDALFREREDRGDRISLVFDHERDKTIGYLALVDIDWKQATVGNMAVRLHPDWCGKGYGTRMLRSVVEWCFHGGMKSLRLDVAAANERAVRAYEKAGFCRSGEFWRVDENLASLDLNMPECQFLRAQVCFADGKPASRFWWMVIS